MLSLAFLQSKQIVFVCSTKLIERSSRTLSDLGRELGWKPDKSGQDFKNHFLDEARLVACENKQ